MSPKFTFGKDEWSLKSIFSLQFLRYVVVGSMNTGFSYLIYATALYAGLEYWSANLVALCLTIPLSFRAQGILVFHNRSTKRFLRFILSWLALYFVNIALIATALHVGFDSYVAGAVALPFIVALGFVVQKYFVFPNASTD